MAHHLIFEGAELAGKSWLMSQIYGFLEPKYNSGASSLDGCHWFNCDIGVYGTSHGKEIIKNYIRIFKELKDKNLIVEKLHLSDMIYNRLHRNVEIDYKKQERKLAKLGFKTILICFPEDEDIIKQRIQDRLNIYPHYKKIVQKPNWYIQQQREYKKELNNSILPSLIIETKQLPDDKLSKKILNWIGE